MKEDIFERYGRLKELYPDDVEQIESEERRVTELLRGMDYYQLPETQALIALCRNDIVTARSKLARVRQMDADMRAELWAIIDAREWVIRMIAKDYFDAELAAIEQQLDADLSA